MRSRITLLLLVFIATIAGVVKFTDANVLFRFAFGFHAESGDSSEVINKTITFKNGHITITNNLDPNESKEEDPTQRSNESLWEATTTVPLLDKTTTGPIVDKTAYKSLPSMTNFWQHTKNLNGVVDMKLKECVNALIYLIDDLSPVVEKSVFLANRVQIVSEYLQVLEASAAEALQTNKAQSSMNIVKYLRKFIKLVDKLKEPAVSYDLSDRTVDDILMSLLMKKYKISDLQVDAEKQVAEMDIAWQQYVKSKLVEVDIEGTN